MKKIVILCSLAILFIGSTAFSYLKNEGSHQTSSINWMTIEEALERSKTNGKKKILVDLYTDWCHWCKQMDKSTFADPYIAKYINDNYYPVKFDAEQKETLIIDNQTYKFVKGNTRRGYHEFAAMLTGGRMGFPTVVFIDENLGVIQAVPGFQEADRFESIITYFGENNHKTIPWGTFEKTYKLKGKR